MSDTAAGAPPSPASLELQQALLDGLGVKDLPLPEGVTPELMQTIGALLRESMQGAIELLRLRAETKSSLHADMTMLGSRAINPLKAAWDADVALEHLLAPQRTDVMKPVRAVVDAFDDLRMHDRGLAAGIEAAVRSLLERLSPEELERSAAGGSKLDSLLGGNRKAKQWDLLRERYDDLAVEGKQDFWAVFEKEFRRAYATGQRKTPPDAA